MNEHKNNKACLYFHQGWTDIIMCLPMINYYLEKYNILEVIIRSDAKDMVDFYVRGLNNVKIIYIETDNGRFYGQINTNSNLDRIFYHENQINIPTTYDLLFHGEHDQYRKDIYAYFWFRGDILKPHTTHFSQMFYLYYGINFNCRVDNFIFERDLLLEENKYNEFIQSNGVDYVLYHDDETNNQHGIYHVSTKIDFHQKDDAYNYININKKSSIFFDYIKILQNAKEIHLIDSIWACLLYQLDAKYNILNGKEVNIYCQRGHVDLFNTPIRLTNWNLII